MFASLDPRRPSGPPTGVGCGAGGGAAGVLRPKGPAVLPARPSGPGRTDHDMCRPNGPTIPLDARAVRGTVGPLGRSGWWWQPPGPSTLAGRTAGPLGRTTDRSDRKSADVKQVHIPSTRGILTALRSCAPSKRSPTQITRRAVTPSAGSGIVWVPHGHSRTRRSGGRSVCVVHAGLVEPRFLAPPSGCSRCGGRGPGVVAALDPRRPSVTPLGSVVARGGRVGR